MTSGQTYYLKTTIRGWLAVWPRGSAVVVIELVEQSENIWWCSRDTDKAPLPIDGNVLLTPEQWAIQLLLT